MTTDTPPRWAEAVLRAVLAPHDRQTVSGDLLEEYRERVHPMKGRGGADLWYVRQVAGFVWRANWAMAALLAGTFVGRFALDSQVPTTDFYLRATVSTWASVLILLCAGFLAAWRTRSATAGTIAGVVAALIGAMIDAVAVALLLAIWHDAPTLAAINGSGGLGEVFTIPVMLVVPGALLGTLGGLFALIFRRPSLRHS